MPRFTYNFELDSSPDRLGRWAIMLRVHKKDCKPARLGTGEWLQKPQLHWAAKVNHKKPVGDRVKWGYWVVRHPDSEAINERLKTFVEETIQKPFDAWLKAEPLLTPAEARDRHENPPRDNYLELANEAIQAMFESGSVVYATAVNRESVVRTFGQYLRPGLTLQQLTTAEVENFQQYLRYTYRNVGKVLKASTINHYIDALNAVHMAILMRRGMTRQQARKASPFVEVDKLTSGKTSRTRLSEQQIAKAGELDVASPNKRVSPDEAFQVWLLAYLLAGARFSDVLFLRYSHIVVDEQGNPIRLNYCMSKTGTQVNFALGEDARKQLARWWKPGQPPAHYVLPFVSNKEPFAPYLTREALNAAPLAVRKRQINCRFYWSGVFNRRLKEIQEQLGLTTPLSFHASRHSFADLARRVMQEDKTLTLLDISLMLGQRDPKMVMVYIEEMEKQDADRPMQAVFNRSKGNGLRHHVRRSGSRKSSRPKP